MGDDLTEADFLPERIEEVRTEVKRLIGACGLKIGDVAKEADIGASTLQAFMAGTYTGNNSTRALILQRWITGRLAQANAARVAPRAPEFTLTPTAQSFAAIFEHAQFTPDIDVIVGEPGVGKTTAGRQYAKVSLNAWLITCMPNAGSVGWLESDLADAIGLQAAASGSNAWLNKSILRRLRGLQSVVLVDEAQHLSMTALDQLRSYHDQCGVGVVLMGNRSIVRRMEGGTRAADFAQLSSRVGMKVDRKRPQTGDVDMLLDAWGIENGRVRQLARAVARREGALRRMTKVLRQAHLRALDSGGPVTPEHVEAAARQLVDDKPLDEGEAA